MNRRHRVTLSVLLATAAAGFAAGWFSQPDGKPVQDLGARRRLPASYNYAATAPVAPTTRLPELETVDACRTFLLQANRNYSSSHPYVRQAVRDFALRRWLELDAESALTEAERQPGNEFSTEGFAPDLFRVWLDLNVDSAISAWNQSNPILARNVRLAFLTTLADKDPEKAFAVWQTPRGRGSREADPASEEIFRRWAQRDPRRAIAKAGAGSYEQSTAIREWAQAEPREALAYVRSMPNGDQYLADAAFLPLLLRADPGGAQTALQKAGRQSWDFIGRDWAERDLPNAMAWAQHQPPDAPLVRSVLIAAADKLASTEPERALEILRQQVAQRRGEDDSPENTRRQEAIREAFASLAITDPARIRALVASDPELAKGGGMAGYFSCMFAGNPAAAIAQYREWAANPALKEAAMAAVLAAFDGKQGGGAGDPSELLAAVPELADKVNGQVLSGWARANPTEAADFILQRMRAGKNVDDLQEKGVLAELAISQPKYTSLWLQRLPDPELQQQTAQTLAANWSAFDPQAAAEWINGLPDGNLREAALAGYDRRAKRSQGASRGE